MELIPVKERHEKNRCWFCNTNKSVKYRGKIPNAYAVSINNEWIDIIFCNKCAARHSHYVK